MVQIGYIIVQALEALLGWRIAKELFPERRKENKRFWGLEIGSIVLLSGLYAYNASFCYFSNSFIPFYSFVTAFQYLAFHKYPYGKIFIFYLFYFLNLAILKMPLLTIRGINEKINIVWVNHASRNIWELVWCLILMICILIIQKQKIVHRYLWIILEKYLKVFVGVVILEWWLLTYCMYNGGDGFRIFDIIANLVVIFCIVVMVTLLVVLIAYQNIENEKCIQTIAQDILKKQYQELSEQYEKNSHRLHDIKHVMQHLRHCIEQGGYSEAVDILNNYLDIQTWSCKTWTGFKELDFILNYKKAEMEQYDIEFVLDTDVYDITIDALDIMIILGNLLDNAIEAAKQCDQHERHIRLKMRNVNAMFLINIENNCICKAQYKEGRFESTKQDSLGHGYGIQSVKNIVDKYDGQIAFEFDEQHFSVEIFF